MKRKWSMAVPALAICVLACACTVLPSPSPSPVLTALPSAAAQPTPTAGLPTASPTVPPAPEMAKYLPAERFTWQYTGFAEYGHTMTLESIEKQAGEWIYHVTGEVADMSDGEMDSDLSISLTYTVTDDALIQEIDAPMMMDASYQRLELLHRPLEAGARWQQQAQTAQGKTITLDCSIEAIQKADGQQYLIVRYDNPANGYYEKRVVLQDTGVVEFVKLYQSGQESFEMGYYLNAPLPVLPGAASGASSSPSP